MNNLDGKMKGFKIKLYPSESQKIILSEYMGVFRYVYNMALDIQADNLYTNNTLYSKIDMNNILTEYKKSCKWLTQYDSTTLKIAVFDATTAFNNYLNKLANYPNYKSKKSKKQKFAIRSDRLKIFPNMIYCPGIGYIQCGSLPDNELIGQGYRSRVHPESYKKYYDARITFDGCNYWIGLTMERKDNIEFESIKKRPIYMCNPDTIIGIDVGCKNNNWIVDSLGGRAILPDTSKEDKKISMLNKKLDRERQARAKSGLSGDSNNMKKTKAEINKYYQRKTNKRKSAMYDYIAHGILDKHPSKVIIEDISPSEWMVADDSSLPIDVKNKINKMVSDSGIYDFQKTLEYKLKAHDIELVKAEKGYKSTQICSSCGAINKIGNSRVYRCEYCGLVIDRDYNSALNLQSYKE